MLGFVLSLALAFMSNGSASNIETLQGTVSSVNSKYTIVDTVDGNGWALEDTTKLAVNDEVIILFDNMGTSDIYDDEIISISICGKE